MRAASAIARSRLGLQRRPDAARSVSARLLNVGVLREGGEEQRVGLVPSTAKLLKKDGYTVHVEKGAGRIAGFPDSQYEEAGCVLGDRSQVIGQSKLFFSVNPPTDAEMPAFKDKSVVAWVGRLLPDGKKTVESAAKSGVQLIDTTAVPRITIAQKLDVLSSQAKVAGHRGVIEAALAFGRFHAPEMTAAGKYPPSQTMVLGCGVAGLAAIGTSKALGSVVRAWDVRDVSDQVKSMGAGWVKVDFKEDGAGAGGYAKESSDAFQAAQKAEFHKNCKECDIVISTAAIPGRPSPKLIEDYMVKDMKPGSVIVDLAAAGGGNCTLTKPGEKYVTENGVTIIGYTDNPGRMAQQSSSMYSQNMLNLVQHITKRDGASVLLSNMDAALEQGEKGDIVTRSIICTKDGKTLEMPPPPQPTPVKPKKEPTGPAVKVVDPFVDARDASLLLTGSSAGVLGLGLACAGDAALTGNIATFTLAGAAGYQVVWGVAHALHTPLMSVTNAISGMTAAGGLMILGGSAPGVFPLAALAVGTSAVNISGGFIVSQRMLALFKRPGDVDYSYLNLAPGAVLVAAPFLNPEIATASGIASSMLCVGAIGALAGMKTAQGGAYMGMSGVAGGLAATLASMPAAAVPGGLALLAGGGAVGTVVGTKVSPMVLPQTVAAFHSLVGFAAMTTSIGSHLLHPNANSMHMTAALAGNYIGGVTLTGSLVAFGKLNGNMSSTPLNLPGKNMINAGMALAQVGLGASLLSGGGMPEMIATAALSSVMGVHLVGSVGGGDMPVCITVLNSYSGWALVAEGFLLNSPVLTIIGSLIGFSGAILTKIMCDAMNRDIANVIFGGLNIAPPKKDTGDIVEKVHVETSVDAAGAALAAASDVVIVPGYGMAVSRSQASVAAIAKSLRDKDVRVRFGIHPVAGRMPGQMNVLLAEAGVPYDWVLEMEEINPDMGDADVCMVIGANDITNSAAVDDEDCPLYGMPVLEVWQAKKTIFMKRSMAGGYADIENPVFYKETTEMLLGDAKSTTEQLARKVSELLE